ncbi:hypothetical protein F4604DRAFT_1703910 [Suillus subluteus]|nr:hypothetical protein F4604DRAFT_1703910 [Suillus subluteus]
MAQTRCQYFDESGNSRNGGCFAGDDRCKYVHPGNPAWDTAQSRGPPRGRGMGRGGNFVRRGSGPVNMSRSSSASGWDTGGGYDNNAQSSGSGWAITSSSAKDSGKQANIATASLWDTADPWGMGSDSGTKESSSKGGWGESDTWGGNSATKDASGGGWGNAPGGDKSSSAWGAAETMDTTSRAQEKPRSSEAMETSAGAWGDTSNNGWGNPPGGDKISSGWGASGTTEMASLAQPKRNDADQENHRFKPSPMTGTNDVPMVNTRWNKKVDTTAPPHAESSEKPRLPPLQTSALSNAILREPPAPMSASRSEDDRMDVDSWRQDAIAIPEKARDRSPSLLTAIGSAVNRKRKYEGSDLEKKQEIWKDFIRICDRAVRAKVDLTKAEAERQNWRRMQKSTNYSRIGEAGRNRLDGHRAELEKICAGHSDKLSQAISELAEVGDKLKSGIDYEQRYNIGPEVTRYAEEVGAWISDIRQLLIANTTQHPPNTDQPTSHEDEPSEEPSTIPDGLNALRSRLDKQEETLEELRTALTLESSNNSLATINNTIDKKIDVLRKDRAEAKAQRAKLPPPKVILPPEATGAIEDVSRKAAELSAAMEAPVNDVAKLLIRQNDMQKTQASFKTENEELKESIAKLTETSAANRKLIQEQTEAIQRLRASLEAASELQRVPPPPAESPVKVMLDDLRTAVDGVLHGIVSREVIPTISRLRDDCWSENQHFHKEVFEIIWDKIEPSLKIAEAVNRWASRLELSAS